MVVQETIPFLPKSWYNGKCFVSAEMSDVSGKKVKVEPDFCKAKDSNNLLRDAVENQSYA